MGVGMGGRLRGLLSVVAVVLAVACGAPSRPPPETGRPPPGTGLVPPLHPSVDGYPEAVVTLTPAGGGRSHRVRVKVADTAERRRHGLMEVPELPAGTGMLFVFPDEQRGGFWMKNTLVPLSIAFADAAGRVVEVLRMRPCPTPPPSGCPLYTPGAAYRMALEVPAGYLRARGLGRGAHIAVDPDPRGRPSTREGSSPPPGPAADGPGSTRLRGYTNHQQI